MREAEQGFTLAELAIVLVIVALLIGGLLLPISAQIELRKVAETQRTLAIVGEALLGFAASNGRLPCPASATSSGIESFCSNATGACTVTTSLPTNASDPWRCSSPRDGFLPAATLGLSPVDDSGYLIDGWNSRVRYAIVDKSALLSGYTRYIFTAPQGMQQRTLSSLADDPDLRICADAACARILSSNAVAVVLSLGRNGSTAATGADELENLDGDKDFVSHEATSAASPNGEFDDIVTWLSPNVLYNRMIVAGQLP